MTFIHHTTTRMKAFYLQKSTNDRECTDPVWFQTCPNFFVHVHNDKLIHELVKILSARKTNKLIKYKAMCNAVIPHLCLKPVSESHIDIQLVSFIKDFFHSQRICVTLLVSLLHTNIVYIQWMSLWYYTIQYDCTVVAINITGTSEEEILKVYARQNNYSTRGLLA